MSQSLSFGSFAQFSWNNSATNSTNLTSTYYDTNGQLATGPGSSPLITPVGFNTKYPLGLTPGNMNDLFYNTKSIYYKVSSAGSDIGEFITTGTSSGSTGILGRIITDSSNIYGRKFTPMIGVAGSRNSVDDIAIDFTQCFSKLTKASDYVQQYSWLPKITFNVVSASGSITIGQSSDTPVDFTNFSPPILDAMYVYIFLNGSDDDTIGFEMSMSETERYDDIYFTPYMISAGQTLVIKSPPISADYDMPGFRTGFADLYSIQFTGSQQIITNFPKLTNVNHVVDTVQVVVPNDAKTGPIKFNSKYSTTNALLYDNFQTVQSIVIS